MKSTTMKFLACFLAIPAYLLAVHLSSGRLLIGYGEGVWTIEYLVPALVCIALAFVAFRANAEVKTDKAIRVLAIAGNLLLAVGLATATVSLWGESL